MLLLLQHTLSFHEMQHELSESVVLLQSVVKVRCRLWLVTALIDDSSTVQWSGGVSISPGLRHVVHMSADWRI